MNDLSARQKKGFKIIIAYPFVVLIISVLLNLFVFGIEVSKVALPSENHLGAIIIAGILLVINHSLLMTTTEITRVRYGMYATPEEWRANDRNIQDVSQVGIQELTRHHNAHRNATENTCYFLAVAIPFMLASSSLLVTYVWIVGFSVSRLGHSIAYLKGNDGLRGLFMTTSLISLYGMASYLVLSWSGFRF